MARFGRNSLAFLHDFNNEASFTTWDRTWTLPMSSTANSAFELSGSVQEVGRLGMEYSNADNATRTLAGGGATNFRNRFPASPSSITFSSLSQSSGFSGNPSTFTVDRDGFGYFSYQSIPGFGTVWWFGTYTAVA